MALYKDNQGVIQYTEAEAPYKKFGVEKSGEFAIASDNNILKQIKFKIIPDNTQQGTLTLEAHVSGDATVSLTDLLNILSFSTVHPPIGSNCVAANMFSQLSLSSTDGSLEINGTGSNTINFRVVSAPALTLLQSQVTNLVSDLASKLPKSGGTLTGRLTSKVVTLTDGPIIQTDASLGDVFDVTLGAPLRVLANPTNGIDAQRCVWRVRQDPAGNRKIDLDTKFIVGSNVPAINLTAGANKTDIVTAIYSASLDRWFVTNFDKGF